LDYGEALNVAIAVGDALDKAHRAGVVQWDLKPSSVMLAKDGAKLVEFGLAELQPSSAAALVPKSASATVAASGEGGPAGCATVRVNSSALKNTCRHYTGSVLRVPCGASGGHG
jgi:serine/threonine protein kinase